MDELTDIVRAAQDGDKDAFGAIVKRFQDMAYGRAYAWLKDHGRAEDAAQDAFVDAYVHLGQLREPAAFPGWFGRIVTKHADRQQRSRRSVMTLDDVPNLKSRDPDPLESLYSREMAEIVKAKVDSLSEDHREAISLFHLKGHSQNEIALFLGVPVSTVKKRLYDARKQLKRRMGAMAPKETKKQPSQDESFERRVRFFIAVRERDFATLEQLIGEDESLLSATTDPDTAPMIFGSREVTATSWAIHSGDREMLSFLVDSGASLDQRVKQLAAPLHHAVMVGEVELARLLIEKGAGLNANTMCGQTVLHRAVMTGELPMIDLLVSSGIDQTITDEDGRTAVDCTVLKGRADVQAFLQERGGPEPKADPVEVKPYVVPDKQGSGMLGRMLDADGQAVDGRGEIENFDIPPCDRHGERGAVLETGIKGVDLFAPIRRVARFRRSSASESVRCCLPGKWFTTLVIHDNARVVYITAPEGNAYQNLREYWYGTGNAFRNGVVFLVADPNAADARLRATVAKGFELANGFRDAGYDVLVKLQGRLVPHADLDTLNRGADDRGSITTYLTSDPPNGLADNPHELDSVIYMSAELANVALYPAVDDEHCRLSLLEDDTFSQAHRDTVAEVRRRFYEYRHFNLDSIVKGKGELYMNDGGLTEVRMKRARRIRMFLTQSYHGTEIWTNKMGETVPLANTVDTCRRILNGEFDDTPLDVWYMMGGLEGIQWRIAEQTG